MPSLNLLYKDAILLESLINNLLEKSSEALKQAA